MPSSTHHATRQRRSPWDSALQGALLLALSGWLTGCGGDSGGGAAQGTPAAAAEAPGQPPRGHWYRAREGEMTDAQSARAKALEGIGYASGMESALGRDSGVGFLAETLVQPGFSFYTSGHGPEAFLIDEKGGVLHRWQRSVGEIWPDSDLEFAYFRKARLFGEGLILAIFEGHGMVALDADSKVLWTYDRPAHHDVHQAPDGSFFALDRDARVVPELHPDRPLLDDGIVFLEEDGRVRGRVSIMGALLDSKHGTVARKLLAKRIADGTALEQKTLEQNKERLAAEPELRAKIDYIGDCLHTNSVRRIGSAFAAQCDVLEEGWYLVSIRELNLLAAIEVADDFQSGRARWLMRGEWRKQHEAVPLDSGAIMLFDNRGRVTESSGRRSRVIDIDPKTGAVLSSIDGVGDFDFHSLVGGSCQRLANGNTLVIESTGGSAFEVTPDGELAWSFHNPHRAGDDDELVAFLPDLIRVPVGSVQSWLAAAGTDR